MRLRVLIVEDSEDDVRLLMRALTRGGFEVTSRRVDTALAMQTALADGPWDVVLSDHTMPEFSSLGALETLKQSGLDLPFIIVSGLIGEDVAVEAMKAGAHDYILKRNLTRLGPAIERELGQAEVRRERRQAWEDLERLNADLERRIAERTAQLAAANRKLEQEAAERELLVGELQAVNQRLVEASLREQELAAAAQHRTAELEATISSIADGLVIYGPAGNILQMNAATAGYFDFTPAEYDLPIERRLSRLQLETAEGDRLSVDEFPAVRALRGETVRDFMVVMRRPPARDTWLSMAACSERS